jgi:Mg2+/Co2+ transporter CorB
MLLSILDLEQVRVEQVMVPRHEVVGIDLEDDINEIIQQLQTLQHTLLPIYNGDLDNVQGILHTRNVMRLLTEKNLNKEMITQAMEEPYFVPEGTSLQAQLLYFQQNKRRMALVMDEYSDVLGLLTLEDILEEIVGEFTTDVQSVEPDIQAQVDGSFLVDGSMSIRELNRNQQWHLPLKGPTTLNGLITETLESLPVEGLCLLIGGYPIEVIQMKDNAVKLARIFPRIAAD